ncbi:MAG: phage tail protein, partial [Porticoccaceae bacterium]|nr:phage tail protein [Porticoccaceae bacterium]
MSFYGDQTRWFVGTVVDVNDPLKLDRVRVRIHGVHSSNTVDIPNQDLPWAQVNIPVTEDGSSGLGANC